MQSPGGPGVLRKPGRRCRTHARDWRVSSSELHRHAGPLDRRRGSGDGALGRADPTAHDKSRRRSLVSGVRRGGRAGRRCRPIRSRHRYRCKRPRRRRFRIGAGRSSESTVVVPRRIRVPRLHDHPVSVTGRRAVRGSHGHRRRTSGFAANRDRPVRLPDACLGRPGRSLSAAERRRDRSPQELSQPIRIDHGCAG